MPLKRGGFPSLKWSGIPRLVWTRDSVGGLWCWLHPRLTHPGGPLSPGFLLCSEANGLGGSNSHPVPCRGPRGTHVAQPSMSIVAAEGALARRLLGRPWRAEAWVPTGEACVPARSRPCGPGCITHLSEPYPPATCTRWELPLLRRVIMKVRETESCVFLPRNGPYSIFTGKLALLHLSVPHPGAPAPPADPSFLAGPTAPWSPAPSPATTCCRRCTRFRRKAGLIRPQPGPVTWEGTQPKDSGRKQGGSLLCVWCLPSVCQCGVCVLVCFLSGFGFLHLLCWTGPGPARGELAPRQRGCKLLCH